MLVNGPGEIYVEQKGRLVLTDRRFNSAESLLAAIRNISQFVGRSLDHDHPYLDARLPDGSRVHAMLPPVARRGPYLAIRRFAKDFLGMEDLVRLGALPHAVADFLRACVIARKNLVVAGGTGSGKTTFLNLLSAWVPAEERIIVIEDSSELKLKQAHVLPMEPRSPTPRGGGRCPSATWSIAASGSGRTAS